jgi:nitrile hydratase
MTLHDHEHDHEKSGAVSHRVAHLIENLERCGILTRETVDATVEDFLEKAVPHNGKRAISRAWVDPAFKQRLLADANAAVAELGIDLSHWSPVVLRAVENTPDRHNVIVCTLCSCYPIALLGPSPTWYKSEAYRSQVVRDPRGVLAEFGFRPAESVHIDVWDSTAEIRYLVIPMRPPQTEHLSEAELVELITRDGMIGTAAV